MKHPTHNKPSVDIISPPLSLFVLGTGHLLREVWIEYLWGSLNSTGKSLLNHFSNMIKDKMPF